MATNATEPTHLQSRRRSWLLALCLLLVSTGLFAPTHVDAQDAVMVQVEVDRNVLTTDERLVLTVTVQGGQADSPPILPPLQALRVVGQNSATQVTSVNGVVTAVAAYRYQLQPLEVGSFRIDPITVVVGGQQYQTNGITIEVQQGTAPLEDQVEEIVPPTELQGQDFYVEAEVDKPSPYLGEQVLYTFRFYQATALLARPSYESPDFVGFWNSNESQRITSLAEVGGRVYQITTLFAPIFPTTTGELTIPESALSLPDGRVLLTNPVMLNVRPLPDPAPEGFSGAVGQFQISSAIEPQQLPVGDSATLRVVISGVGNIDTLPEPALPELDGWRSFENQNVVNTEFANNVLQGGRVYERFLIPSEPGNFTLPSLEYIYFDPQTERYEVTATDAFDLVVVGSAEAGAEDATTLTEAESSAIVLQPLKDTPNRLSTRSLRLASSWWFWALWLLPIGLVIGNELLRIRQARVVQIEEERKRSSALKLAQQALKAAKVDKATRADEAAERILTTYLANKYNRSFVGMSQTARAEALRALDVRESRITWINRIYEQIQQTRYGFDAPERGKLLDEVDQVIRQFERADSEASGAAG